MMIFYATQIERPQPPELMQLKCSRTLIDGLGPGTSGALTKARIVIKPDRDQRDRQPETDIAEALARLVAHRDAPLGGEQPHAVGEMPRRRDDADDVGATAHGFWNSCCTFQKAAL